MTLEFENIINIQPQEESGGGGGGATAKPYTIKVIDYDGSIIDEQGVDVGEEYTLPTSPTHTGLVFQDWSSPVAITDGKITAIKGNIVVGTVYTTASGKSEFDIELTPASGLSITFKMSGNKDWGDGTTGTSTSHTYTDYGSYTIKCDGTSWSSLSSSGGLFGQTTFNHKGDICKRARITGITTIGTYCFYWCPNLESITISKDVTQIDAYGINYCPALLSIVLPSTFKTIKTRGVAGNHKLRYLVLPSTLKTINGYGLEYNGLLELTLPGNITTLDDYVCQYCQQLQTVTYAPGTLTKTGVNAFQNCYGLYKVYLADNIKVISNATFHSCYNLESIDLPPNTTTLGDSALYAVGIRDLSIPQTVTSIGSQTFAYQSLFRNLVIPSGVTTVSNSCFYASYVESIKFEGDITAIDNGAFEGCGNCIEYDFSHCTTVPTLGSSNFTGINQLCKIKVPLSLEDTWKATSGWSSYANYIVGVQHQDDEGGDTPVVQDIGAMYQQTSSDGNTWSTYSEMTSNTVAELAILRPFSTSGTALLDYWNYTGVLSLTLKFTYGTGVDSTWSNSPFYISYSDENSNWYSVEVYVGNNRLKLNYSGAITKQLTAGHTYTIKLSLDANTNKSLLYCKEEGVDSDFVLMDTHTTTAPSTLATAYISISNILGDSNYINYKFADFDLADITIDINGTVIFSRT